MATRKAVSNLRSYVHCIFTDRKLELMTVELVKMQTTLDELTAARKKCLTVIDGGKAGEVNHVR